jgi:hypothetical protein
MINHAPDARITSVGQYVSYLEAHCRRDGLVFRGQRVDKPLVPQLSRLRPRGMTRAALERVLVNEFIRTAPPHLDIIPESMVEWLAVARHYGMATRLLDWTFNPLAALWFVVERRPGRTDGVIWILESTRFDEIGADDALAITREKIVRPRHIVGRIVSQLGLFTIHPLVDDEFIPLDQQPEHAAALKKLTIDRDGYPEIRRVLDRCGVNASTIYPGLDGLCAHLQWAYTRERDESPDDAAAREHRLRTHDGS